MIDEGSVAIVINLRPDPPVKSLLETLGEEAHIRRLDRESIEEAAQGLEKAKTRAAVRQQENVKRGLTKVLHQWKEDYCKNE